MGNIIRIRRKVTEELDSLSQKMEAFRDDIERTAEGLDSLIAKKKSLLETIKETETFKVAKEILDKYDEQIPKMESISRTLCGQLENAGSNQLLFSKPAHTKNVPSEATPKEDAVVRPRVQPIRPFQKESVTLVDKMVDYFFGDGPSQRYALICINCHGHNGMALPVEYEYLAFVCFICGHFNPARKFKPVKLLTGSPGSSVHSTTKPHLQTDSPILGTALLDNDREPEKTIVKEIKPCLAKKAATHASSDYCDVNMPLRFIKMLANVSVYV
ncbi:unnamed protein product [Angiostrongylus costaricensis]|uniref:Endoplasmic reticulum junction formation protein lunapark n=1 Tax=Angiostrongylus costaricensis TaxID=334426 RepID=A0A0R3PE74_ANGCS|nr:unnamed protein product [Angiostrongylus costaricensis]